MSKKTILKTLAMAMLMPAMLLTTACSSEDDLVNNTANTENTINKGYALPVTVNVTRQGDATTRATYNESTKKLEFSTGDKLFVYGSATAAGSFAGALDYVPATGKFSGTIYTEKEWTGTADALFTAANEVTATLLPNGYDANGSNSFLSIDNKNTTDIAYDDRLTVSYSKAFVASETAKATGVEQLSLERTSTYSNGFALSPGNAILNFTISGLEAGAKNVSLQLSGLDNTVTGSVTPNAGVATFAIGVSGGSKIKDMDNNLTVGSSNFTLPSSTTFAAGKIYNIARNAIPGALIGQFSVSSTKKVYFSKGNLQATTTDMGTSWTWTFAANQWSYVGNAAANNAITGNGTVSSNGTVDLFGWSTSATTYGMNTSTSNSTYSGNFVDWGNLAISNGGNTANSGWRTLSSAEWTYLFNTRTVNGGKGSGKSYTLGQNVNNILGVVLYPDDYTGAAYTTGSNWSTFESAGCVFLPAAGSRQGTSVSLVGSNGYYWSGTVDSTTKAYRVTSYSGGMDPANSTGRNYGCSVRLVRDVQ